MQPIDDPEQVRRFIIDGIGIEMTCLDAKIKDKNDEIYSIANNYVRK